VADARAVLAEAGGKKNYMVGLQMSHPMWYIIGMFKIFIKRTDPFTQIWWLHSEQSNLADALRLVGMIEGRINHPPHAIKVVSDGETIFNWSRI